MNGFRPFWKPDIHLPDPPGGVRVVGNRTYMDFGGTVSTPTGFRPNQGFPNFTFPDTRAFGRGPIPRPPFQPPPRAWAPPGPRPGELDNIRRILERRAQEEARRQAEQAQARERALREQRERQRQAELERQRQEQERRRAEAERARLQEEQRILHQIQEQQRLRDEMARLRRLHEDEQRRFQERLRTQQQVISQGVRYLRDPQSGAWLRGGQTAENERLTRLGPQNVAIDRVALHAAMVAPLYEATLRTLTILFAGLGVAEAGPQAVLDVAQMTRDVVNSFASSGMEVSKAATESNNPLHTVQQLQVAVIGSVTLTKMDQLVKELGQDYAKQLAAAEKSVPKNIPHREKVVGRVAEKLLQQVNLPKRLAQYGIDPGKVIIEPWTGATGQKGGQTRYDLGIEGKKRWAMIELKASGYEVPRSEWQLQTHLIGVGEGTATYGKAGDYYRIIADERTILKWSSENLQRSFRPTPSTGRIRAR